MDEAERMILDARLQNWGRWSRETRRPGTSTLWPVLEMLRMMNARDDEERRPEPDDSLPPPDPIDAEIVETAILRMPQESLTDIRARDLLVMLYVNPSAPLGRVLHTLHIRQRAVEPLLRRAQDLLWQRLKAPRRPASVRLPTAPRGLTKHY